MTGHPIYGSCEECGSGGVDISERFCAACASEVDRLRGALALIAAQPTLALAKDPVGHGGLSAWHVRKIVEDALRDSDTVR